MLIRADLQIRRRHVEAVARQRHEREHEDVRRVLRAKTASSAGVRSIEYDSNIATVREKET